MRRPDITDLGVLALGLGGALVDPRDPGEPRIIGKEFVFSVVLWSTLGLLLRQAAATVAATMSERRRARTLRHVDLTVAAGEAVRGERERLSAELDDCIRRTLEGVRDDLAAVDRGEDARAAALRIHHRAREATSELRRQLGLLRQSGADEPAIPQGPRPGPTVTRMTVVLTVGAMALAAVDAWAGRSLYGPEFYAGSAWRLPWSGLLGVAVAATLVGRRVAPNLAASLGAGMLVLPREAGGVMVSAGFGLLVTVGVLTWALSVRGLRERGSVAAAVVLGAATVESRLRDDPRNAGFLAVCLAIIWVAGYVVGVSRRRRAAAAGQADQHQSALDAACDLAVQSERLAVARELHDVVSHAVGVIAMQAAAAQVSWPADPHTALKALETIDRTATHALADLEHVVPGETIRTGHDLHQLLDRIRATGTTVDLTQQGPHTSDAVVYRIVQEGLTNAVRHAPGARVDVHIHADDDGVRVRIADDGPGLKAGTGRGFGLVGLAERVQLRGGTLRTGAGAGGRGFALDVVLPRPSVEATR